METVYTPKNWNDLPSINEVGPFTVQDEQCMNEIRDVLIRHNRTMRFGVALLHQHFALSTDEVLIEDCDTISRTLTTRPVGQKELRGKHYRPTVWRFDGQNAHGCSYCPTDEEGNHNGYKDPC